MFFTVEKLENRMHELERLRYRERMNISLFSSYTPDSGAENTFPSVFDHGSLKVGDHWSGRDHYLWLNTEVTIPDDWKTKRTVAFFDLGRTGGGNNSGFESLFFLNGQAFQGVDSNHREVLLPDSVSGQHQFTLQLWSGLEGGGQPSVQTYQLKEAWVGWLDENTDQLYYMVRAILESVKQLDEHQVIRSKLLSALNRSSRKINWQAAGEERFYESVSVALSELSEAISDIHLPSEISIRAVGHSHIDLAWLWRTKHTKEKAVRTFRTVLRLMELYPDYTYLQSQPQLYEWIRQEDPELFEEIRRKIKEGQWEVEGSMWVEADCNIPSGESFVRQLLYGKRFFEKEFGIVTRSLWLPDVFGYSWSLPQILKKSGIDTFMTTKISWNQYNRMPHDTFRWRGIDGSEILTHFITTPEPGRPEDSWFYTYNGLISGETVTGIWKQYRDKEINQELLLAYGYGDGGGGVNRDMIEMKRHLDGIPAMPEVKSGKAADYFTDLHHTIDQADGYVHTWDGELYLEYHRGTYTSQARMKQENRKLEFAYRELEMLAVMHALDHGFETYPAAEIEKGWKYILLNQFHDIIPGSSIHEVYEDAHRDYAAAWELFHMVKKRLLTSLLAGESGSAAVLHKRELSKPVLVHHKGELSLIEPSAGAGITALTPVTPVNSNHFVTRIGERFVQTPFYHIKWNEKGQLISIIDLDELREMLDGTGNVLRLYEDRPMAHDAWDIDLYYIEKSEEIDRLISCTVNESSPFKIDIMFKWQHDHADIEQTMVLYTHTKRIDFETKVDWRARQQLLKAEFPLQIRSTEAIYDIQFGNVKRPTHWNTSWEMARFESVGHKWAALSEVNYGIGVLNDSKYGYGIKDNLISLSLLKGPVYPDPEADLGIHHFTYALFPFKGSNDKHQIEEEALVLNDPPEVLENTSVNEHGFLIRSGAASVLVDAIKKAEERQSVIVRFHEMEGSRVKTAVESGYKVIKWRFVNLLEEPVSDWNETGDILLTFNPYEINSIEIEFA
ncbi:alpha-mannosidase [Jeotgalibacillus haloalkalitolerans]|uniref:Alpha-mannosidase n=1 Tax=Jeotgalibacillus haloalkalitolerans TaxID=3104292 RepID=A0ABU5KKZ8_9BACL|nr:alpha-mannosidase [Jeotgalibacillus sp. HH7-29]MDZ5711421.1 alpha-mannosidase [Jeotgalibacillus sp. HH7-29]